MKGTRFFLVALGLLFSLYSTSQNKNISGKIYGRFGGEKEPITGAAVYYLDSETLTTTDKDGWFQLEFLENRILVVQYIGFKPDTFRVVKPVFIELTLQNDNELETIELTERIKATELNKKSASLEFNIGQKELAKAACCNLSESFETNPAVDASFADAVTGTRQIELLGLAGKYSQIQLEMIPFVRGVSSNYGLTHIPGPWISSMQLSKGAGSVTNGFESMTGQINVELHKPDGGPKLLLNVYGNASGRAELNLVTAQKVSEKWNTVILAHASSRFRKNDNNNDGFLDMPLSRQYNLINKWKYTGGNGFNTQIGIRVLDDVMQGGQLDFDHNNNSTQTDWGSEIKNQRIELFGKIGYILPNQNLSSVGFIYSIYQHDLKSYFGLNKFNSKQQSVYLNLMYQSIIGTSEHQYKIGISTMYDRYTKERDFIWYQGIQETQLKEYQIQYLIPGAFAEYTWNPTESFSFIAGIRGDLGIDEITFSPRLHMRYSPWEKTSFRFGGGKGFRLTNVMEENLSLLASSRVPSYEPSEYLHLEGVSESSWNLGLSYVQEFKLNYREGTIIIDYFHTIFENQVINDVNGAAGEFNMYNLENGSSSSTVSIQVDYEPLKRFDVRLAYRYQLAETDFASIGKAINPLTPKNRVLFNIGYETRTQWKFDATWNWFDQKRIPTTANNPEEYQFSEMSPAYSMIHFQVNKTIGKFEFYVGGENMLDFRQDNAIVAPDDPYGPYFDATLVWGPIFGRMFYGGINYRL